MDNYNWINNYDWEDDPMGWFYGLIFWIIYFLFLLTVKEVIWINKNIINTATEYVIKWIDNISKNN